MSTIFHWFYALPEIGLARRRTDRQCQNGRDGRLTWAPHVTFHIKKNHFPFSNNNSLSRKVPLYCKAQKTYQKKLNPITCYLSGVTPMTIEIIEITIGGRRFGEC